MKHPALILALDNCLAYMDCVDVVVRRTACIVRLETLHSDESCYLESSEVNALRSVVEAHCGSVEDYFFTVPTPDKTGRVEITFRLDPWS